MKAAEQRVLDSTIRALLRTQRDVLAALRGRPTADSVHDARIALRRAAELLRLLRKRDPAADPLRKRLQSQVRHRAASRDATVLDELVGRPGPSGDALARLGRHWSSPAWRRTLAAFDAFLAARAASVEPVPAGAIRALIRARRRKLAVRFTRRDALGSDEDRRHEVRKQLRRLRYLYELFGEHLSRRARKRGERLHRLDASLGRLRDLDLALRTEPDRDDLARERRNLRAQISNRWKI